MQINSHLFQASARIYQALLESPNNHIPYDPLYATKARNLAEALYNECNRDPIMTASAASCLCGFMKNKMSSHCSDFELVKYGVMGARFLVQAFGQGQPVQPAPVVQPAPQQASYPVMPAPFNPPNVAPPTIVNPVQQQAAQESVAPFVLPTVAVDVPVNPAGHVAVYGAVAVLLDKNVVGPVSIPVKGPHALTPYGCHSAHTSALWAVMYLMFTVGAASAVMRATTSDADVVHFGVQATTLPFSRHVAAMDAVVPTWPTPEPGMI